jgi:transposase InsO family protein
MVAAKNPRPPARPLDIPEHDWSEAVRRERVVRPLAVAGTNTRADVKAAAGALGLSQTQVYRLIAAFREHPTTVSLVVTRPGPKKGARLLPCDVEQRIERAINDLFMSRERPTMAKLRRDLRTDCVAAGLKPPSRTAIQARVSARSLREMVGAREGSAAARQRFVPVRPGLRPRSPLEVVQIDHTKVDIQLVDDRARAVLGRPWLTLLLDVFSRSVLGFYLSLDAPSAVGVAMAIAQGVLPKAEWLLRNDLNLAWAMHGLPRSLHLDNGAEFHSRALKRGCQQHGVRINYRPPATPRFGGHIERLMGTLMTRVHSLPGTTSSNVIARSDYQSERKAVLTLAEFERILVLEILGPYHNEVHCRPQPGPMPSQALARCLNRQIRRISCWTSFPSRTAWFVAKDPTVMYRHAGVSASQGPARLIRGPASGTGWSGTEPQRAAHRYHSEQQSDGAGPVQFDVRMGLPLCRLRSGADADSIARSGERVQQQFDRLHGLWVVRPQSVPGGWRVHDHRHLVAGPPWQRLRCGQLPGCDALPARGI